MLGDVVLFYYCGPQNVTNWSYLSALRLTCDFTTVEHQRLLSIGKLGRSS